MVGLAALDPPYSFQLPKLTKLFPFSGRLGVATRRDCSSSPNAAD